MEAKMNYKKILEGVVNIINTTEKSDIGFANICTYIGENCPELKESEGEKTKRMLHSIANKMSQHLRDIFTEEEFQCYDAWSNAWLEKQGEQKSTLRIDNSRAKVVFPFKAKLKSTGIVVTIYNGQLSRDGKEWIKYQSDKEDGCNVYEPEDLEPVCNVEQNPAWSEEDEEMIDSIIGNIKYLYSIGSCDNATVDKKVNWLKSLSPQSTWKPSEEQLNALHWCVMNVGSTEHQVLQELLEQLEKLKG